MFYAFIALSAFVILVEYALWHIFRNKQKGIVFPSESDESYFGFLTPWRIRLIAAVHAAALIAVILFVFLSYW